MKSSFSRTGMALFSMGGLIVLGTGCLADLETSSKDVGKDVGSATQALTTCVTLAAGADAMLSNPPKNQTYGAHPILRVGGKDESLIRFDLSAIPAGSIIHSGTLTFYAHGGAGENPIHIHAATAPWSESSVSYASFNQEFASAISGILLPTSPNHSNQPTSPPWSPTG